MLASFKMFGIFSSSLVYYYIKHYNKLKSKNFTKTKHKLFTWLKIKSLILTPKSNQRVACFDVNCGDKTSQTGFENRDVI